MKQIMDIIKSKNSTYEQKVMQLAQTAENLVNPIELPERYKYFFEKEALCDMNEGNAPYRPRYILVDFEKFVAQGSEFLQLDPPKDLDELLNSFCIIYNHIPSITGRPVYIGNLDKLIDPFLHDLSDEEAMVKLKHFLNFLDRTIASAYCHANLGPEVTRAGKLILNVIKELKNAVPNFTFKYDQKITPDSFAEQAILTSLACANPAFSNHDLYKKTYNTDYGICSCYNILPVGGGGYCLTRIVLPRLADLANSVDEFIRELLPEALQALGEYMNNRITFMVEKTPFFETSFLVEEKLVDPDKFVGMLGVVGLHDCVNKLLEDNGGFRYGHDKEADDLGKRILDEIEKFTSDFPAVYSKSTNNRYLLHAQAGLSHQEGITPGVRIKVGDEPDNVLEHIRHSKQFHHYFPTGASDIFPVESTAQNNPTALLDLIKGAFSMNVRYLSFYTADSDLIRITGYLAKRSEMEKFKKDIPVLQDTSHGAVQNFENNCIADRKVRF